MGQLASSEAASTPPQGDRKGPHSAPRHPALTKTTKRELAALCLCKGGWGASTCTKRKLEVYWGSGVDGPKNLQNGPLYSCLALSVDRIKVWLWVCLSPQLVFG